jgi:hypothetical protein
VIDERDVAFYCLVLEVMCFVGLAGSLVVAIVAFVGDIPEFFKND